MKAGIEDAREYMISMRDALRCLHNPEYLYYGREGHLRLARECGAALDDFTEEAQQEILRSSYSIIYVSRCALRPILDASEWINEMRRGLSQRTKLGKIHAGIHECGVIPDTLCAAPTSSCVVMNEQAPPMAEGSREEEQT